MVVKRALGAAAALALSTGLAAAATAVTQADLNVRAGPGTNYPVVGAVPGGSAVEVMGCTGSWCEINFQGGAGYASRNFLGMGGARTVVSEPADEEVAVGVQPPTAAYETAPAYDYSYDDSEYYGPSYSYGYGYGPSVGFGYYGSGPSWGNTWSGRRQFGDREQWRSRGGVTSGSVGWTNRTDVNSGRADWAARRDMNSGRGEWNRGNIGARSDWGGRANFRGNWSRGNAGFSGQAGNPGRGGFAANGGGGARMGGNTGGGPRMGGGGRGHEGR